MGMINILDLRSGNHTMRSILLPRMTRSAAGPRGALARLDIRGEESLLEQSLAYEATEIPTPERLVGTTFQLDFGGLELTVALDTDMMRLSGFERLSEGEMTPKALALAVEHLLTPDLDAYEAHYDTAIAFREVASLSEFSSSDAVLALRMSLAEGRPFNAYIWASDNDALVEMLEQQFEPCDPGRAPRVAVTASIVGPICAVSAADLRQLRAGAVLCPANDWSDLRSQVHLLVKGAHIIRLRNEENGFVTAGDESLFRHLAENATGAEMTYDDDGSDVGSLTNPKTVLTVELHRMEMTLQQLSNIRDGEVLDLDLEGVETVTLCADGKPFAKGRLVQLDDVLGVMVAKLL